MRFKVGVTILGNAVDFVSRCPSTKSKSMCTLYKPEINLMNIIINNYIKS